MKKSLTLLSILLSLTLTAACTDDIDNGETGNTENQEGKCDNGQTKCGDTCIDLKTDNSNCGTCGTVCTGETRCSDGECKLSCSDGQTACGNACADTKTDTDHCGACDNKCPFNQSCVEGECKLQCDESQTVCGDVCSNLKTDPDHCGTCDTKCTDGQACVDGVCKLACPDGWSVCDDTCVNLTNDANHCGNCETKCGTEDVLDAEGNIISLGIPASCIESQCVLKCPADQEVCNDECVNVKSDSNNCGKCGNKCEGNETCIEGKCGIYCPDGYEVCETGCANLNDDNNNCGTCGNACGDGLQCSEGKCVSICDEGLSWCNRDCVDFSSDFSNCGECNHACDASKNEVCSDGQCKASCENNTISCDGSCIDPLTNNQYCGAKDPCSDNKGTVCPDGFSCVSGVCSCTDPLIACMVGTDEQSQPILQCIDSTKDNNYCGCNASSSGMNCAELPNVSEGTCKDSTCTISCKNDFDNCNSDVADGCEIDLANDPLNCGKCGNACPTANVEQAVCVLGACKPQCKKGFTACGDTCIDTSSDVKNCGACGNTCEDGFTCNDGFCTFKQCTLNNGLYAAVSFGNKKVHAYCIKNVDDFYAVRKATNVGKIYPDDNNQNAYIVVTELDFGTDKEWFGIGTEKAPFKGLFLGNGYEITGDLTCTADNCGLFGVTEGAALDAIKLNTAIKTAGKTSNLGALVGTAYETQISNVTVNKSITGYANTGGIVGHGFNTQITGCQTTAEINAGGINTGGIAGVLEKKSEVSKSSVIESKIYGNGTVGGLVGDARDAAIHASEVAGTSIANKSTHTGGIVAHSTASTYEDVSVPKSTIEESQKYAGMIVGYSEKDSFRGIATEKVALQLNAENAGGFAGYTSGSKFDKCISKVKMTSKQNYVGGFVGYADTESHFVSCSSESDVEGAVYVGGFAGTSNSAKFESCEAKGNVNATSYVSSGGSKAYAGGFVGSAPNSGFLGCDAHGAVTGKGCVGGFAAGGSSSVYENCNAYGNVTSKEGRAGGFGGDLGNPTITGCSAHGNVDSPAGSYYAGAFIGVIANAKGSKISKSAAYGNLTSSVDENGGFLGAIWYNASGYTLYIDSCIALGNVKASRPAVGGLVGASRTGSGYKLYISNSYFAGTVSGTNSRIGGIMGDTDNTTTTTVANTYYWEKSSAKAYGNGGFADGSLYNTFYYAQLKFAPAKITGPKDVTLYDTLNNKVPNTFEPIGCTLTDAGAVTIPLLKGVPKPSYCK